MEKSTKFEGNQLEKPPVQFLGYGGPKYIKNCPYRGRFQLVINMQEASIVGKVEKSILKINAALENRQEEYKPSTIEIEVKLFKYTVFILIDLDTILSHVSLKVVELCQLQTHKFKSHG